MKEVIARILIALLSFIIVYLLMAFAVNSLNLNQWNYEQRISVAIVGGILILGIATSPIKITE